MADKPSGFEQIFEGRWVDWPSLVQLACCSCHLVHTIETRLKDGQLQLRFKRNGAATGGLRRHHPLELKLAHKPASGKR
jgi:hypothetical protein